jgi:hypothetical protein
MLGRRLGIATSVVGAAFALAVGLSGPASAATLYQNSNANVMIGGGEVTALNSCIADAVDGVIQTQIVACNQIANSGNFVTLDHVVVKVTSPTSRALLYSGANVSVSVSGGVANAINSCVADAYDGVIQTQLVACNQVAYAGNLVSLYGVAVKVDQL